MHTYVIGVNKKNFNGWSLGKRLVRLLRWAGLGGGAVVGVDAVWGGGGRLGLGFAWGCDGKGGQMSRSGSLVFKLIEELREKGWMVVLKVAPKDIPWIIQGSRSEYDAPQADQHVWAGKWICDLYYMRYDDDWRTNVSEVGDSAYEAVKAAYCRVLQDDERLAKRKEKK